MKIGAIILYPAFVKPQPAVDEGLVTSFSLVWYAIARAPHCGLITWKLTLSFHSTFTQLRSGFFTPEVKSITNLKPKIDLLYITTTGTLNDSYITFRKNKECTNEWQIFEKG